MNVWPLRNDRPAIEVRVRLASGQDVSRWLVADTGAGTRKDAFELILDEDDCLQSSGIYVHTVRLRGAYSGSFPVYVVDVKFPGLGFDDQSTWLAFPKFLPGLPGSLAFGFSADSIVATLVTLTRLVWRSRRTTYLRADEPSGGYLR